MSPPTPDFTSEADVDETLAIVLSALVRGIESS